ncbi:MAG: hypothetical protein AABY22_04405 [Nanoarchaeota archaeon]
MDNRPKTYLLDLDGTLVKHVTCSKSCRPDYKLELLPGTLEKLEEWELKGSKIIITTGRKEAMRIITEKQLSEVGIFFDLLIMGIGGGERVLVNDKKPDGKLGASCYNLERDKGISDLE